jgi:hypothetical protein
MLQSNESSLQRNNTVDQKKQIMSATIKPTVNPLGMGFNIIESSYKRDYSLKSPFD